MASWTLDHLDRLDQLNQRFYRKRGLARSSVVDQPAPWDLDLLDWPRLDQHRRKSWRKAWRLAFRVVSTLRSSGLWSSMATGFNLSSAEVGKVLNKRKIVALVQRLICVQVATYPGLIPYNTEEEGEVGRQPPSPRLIGVEHRPTRLPWKLEMGSFLSTDFFSPESSPTPSNSISCATLDTVTSSKELVRYNYVAWSYSHRFYFVGHMILWQYLMLNCRITVGQMRKRQLQMSLIHIVTGSVGDCTCILYISA